MNSFKRNAAVFLLAAALAASSWADSARLVTIPISGEYWEPAAGGMLVYSGTVTLEWLADGSGTDGWPVRATLVGQAWCKNTGAGYTLYGLTVDSLAGPQGAAAAVSQSMLAIGGNGRPAFNRDLSVSVTLGNSTIPPRVTQIAFAGR
jgi:hypothetical protein